MTQMTETRWLSLMQTLGFVENQECYQALLSAYSESHRRYHTVVHIDATLRHLDSVSSFISQPELLELALWFHDAVYAPFSSSNEKDSADWAVRFMHDNHADEGVQAHVYDLIMATVHSNQRFDGDFAWLVDIGLSILGNSPKVYQQFEKDVRFEYKRVPYFLYKKKRKEILQGFLDRPSIYQTEYFVNHYERSARANIEEALQQL